MCSSAELADKSCVPCRGGILRLTEEEIEPLCVGVPSWLVIECHHLRRELRFSDFRSALAFVVEIGELAEQQNHHPDIYLAWGRVAVEIWTHKIDGLTESDFILAAKIDRLAGAGV